jgi:hypothetical protein
VEGQPPEGVGARQRAGQLHPPQPVHLRRRLENAGTPAWARRRWRPW